jgi:hypothetical protein
MNRTVFCYLIGMFLLGTVGIALVGLLFEYRTESLPELSRAIPASAQGDESRQALMVGGATAARQASYQLAQDERSKASRAMDAALRVVGLCAYIAKGADKTRFREALQLIEDGRHDIQMGRPVRAMDKFSMAADLLEQASLHGQENTPDKSRWGAYEGAQIIDSRGLPMGTLEQIRRSSDGQAEAVLRLGGMQDFLGFFDLGGRQRVIPADRMLYGKPRKIGTTVVALPTFESVARGKRDAD